MVQQPAPEQAQWAEAPTAAATTSTPAPLTTSPHQEAAPAQKSRMKIFRSSSTGTHACALIAASQSKRGSSRPELKMKQATADEKHASRKPPTNSSLASQGPARARRLGTRADAAANHSGRPSAGKSKIP